MFVIKNIIWDELNCKKLKILIYKEKIVGLEIFINN